MKHKKTLSAACILMSLSFSAFGGHELQMVTTTGIVNKTGYSIQYAIKSSCSGTGCRCNSNLHLPDNSILPLRLNRWQTFYWRRNGKILISDHFANTTIQECDVSLSTVPNPVYGPTYNLRLYYKRLPETPKLHSIPHYKMKYVSPTYADKQYYLIPDYQDLDSDHIYGNANTSVSAQFDLYKF